MYQPDWIQSKGLLRKTFSWLKNNAGLDTLKERLIQTPEGNHIRTWFTSNPAFKKTKVYFHGKTGDLTSFVDNIPRDYKNGYNVCVFSYRGYSRNKGKPSEEGLIEDSNAVLSYLINNKKIKAESIDIVAHSLGCAIALGTLAARQKAGLDQKFGKLTLLAPFDSIRKMADHTMFRFLGWEFFGEGLNVLSNLWDNHANLERAKRIVASTELYHGDDDDVIPQRHSLGFKSEVDQYHTVNGVDHFDIVDRYQDMVYGAGAA